MSHCRVRPPSPLRAGVHGVDASKTSTDYGTACQQSHQRCAMLIHMAFVRIASSSIFPRLLRVRLIVAQPELLTPILCNQITPGRMRVIF